MTAKGHCSKICAWTFWLGTNLEEHNSELIHWSLFEAFARLTPENFKGFRDNVILNGCERGKFQLKQKLRATSLKSGLFPNRSFKFWCVVCPSNFIRAYWRCYVLGLTSTTRDACVVKRAPTLGNERPICAPNARWIVRQHRDTGKASGLVNISL